MLRGRIYPYGVLRPEQDVKLLDGERPGLAPGQDVHRPRFIAFAVSMHRTESSWESITMMEAVKPYATDAGSIFRGPYPISTAHKIWRVQATQIPPSHALQGMAGKTGGCCNILPVFFFLHVNQAT